MRPYKRSKERYAVQVDNLTTYADSMVGALTVGEAMVMAGARRGATRRIATITPLGAHHERPRPVVAGEIYGDEDLCSFITGLDEVQTDPSFYEPDNSGPDGHDCEVDGWCQYVHPDTMTMPYNDNFIEPAYPEAYFMGRDYGRGTN